MGLHIPIFHASSIPGVYSGRVLEGVGDFNYLGRVFYNSDAELAELYKNIAESRN